VVLVCLGRWRWLSGLEAGRYLMGLFSSKSTSTTTAQDNSNNVASGAFGLTTPITGNENVINVTSPEAFAFAEKALATVASVSTSVSSQVASDAKSAIDALAVSRQASIPFPLVAAATVVALFYFWSRGK
jgi:hypothetical protein